MIDRDSKRHRALVVYYGVVQTAHLIALIWEGLNYLRTSHLVLLAPPPPGGWSPSTLSILLVLGTLDGILILASAPFVWGTLKRRPWRFKLGGVILSAFTLTALAFALVTYPTGVWYLEVVYPVEVLLFMPIGFLAQLHLRWLIRGADNQAAR